MKPHALLALACLVAGCGGAAEQSSRAPASASPPPPENVGWADEQRGFSLTHPATWQRASEPLTPDLGDPRELLALGTYPLRVGGDRCAHHPVNAVEDLGPRDALLVIFERAPPYAGRGYPPRPARLKLEAGGNKFCVPDTDRKDTWLAFGESGRAFYLLAAVGPDASAETRRQLDAIYDSLEFEPRD